MNTRRLIGILLLIPIVAFATMGSTFASPLVQEEGERVGLFGTVTAVVDGTILLDGGEIVATDEGTRFLTPGVGQTSLADIGVGDRLAIIGVEQEDGSLLALHVLSTPDEAVNTTHVLGVVTEVMDRLITLTDNQGNPFTVELPPGAAVGVGDFITVVSGPGGEAGQLPAQAVANITDVLDRLANDIDQAVGRAQERLQELLGENGDEQLTALLNALERASGRAKGALEAALNSTHSHLKGQYQGAGVKGPFVKVEGFITELEVDGGSGTVTIDSIDDGGVTLDISGGTQIKAPIAVGDFVKARYNLDLEAQKIEIESDKLTFEGMIDSFTLDLLVLDDGTTFVIDGGTEVEGSLVAGAEAKVKARPVGGSLLALEIEVKGEKGEKVKYESGGEVELKGTITALSDTEIKVDGLPILTTPDTEVKGTLALDAGVKVEATIVDGALVALKIKVEEPGVGELEVEGEEHDEDEIEFNGIITAIISDTEIEVDGLPVLITPDTEVKGTLFEGAEVKVEAEQPDGTLIATRIRVEEEMEFESTIASFTSTELVLEDGTTLVIDADTEIDGALSEGAEVEVEVDVSDGTLIATEIKVKGSHDEDGDGDGEEEEDGDEDDDD